MGRREDNASYYQRHKEAQARRVKARKRTHQALLRAFVVEMKDRPCQDCDKRFPPYVMDFHHRYGKEGDIANCIRRGFSLERLTAEIAKCDILCANCHRIRTYAGITQRPM